MALNFGKVIAWCEDQGLNPRDPASIEAYDAAHAKKGGKKKKRRRVMLRVVGLDSEGNDVVFTHEGADHEEIDNLKETKRRVSGVMLMQAATLGGLEACRVQVSPAPDWQDYNPGDDEE